MWRDSTLNICCVFKKTKELEGDLRESKAISSDVVIRPVPVVDSGFSRGGCAKSQNGCANLLFCHFFAENCMKMTEFGPRGARPWRPL